MTAGRDLYERPHQDTVCGHLSDGSPCAIGPGSCGECRVAEMCRPWHDGEQWHCTRPKIFGGRCQEGPVADPDRPTDVATCPHCPAPCRPQRTLRSHRRRLTVLVAVIATGVCLAVLGGVSDDTHWSVISTSSVISPGPLSAHHATMNQGCSACHSAAESSPLKMAGLAFSPDGIVQSQRCLKCHEELGPHAMQPHSLPQREIDDMTEHAVVDASMPMHTRQQVLSRMLGPLETSSSGDIACATCHQEHRGSMFDLTAMTNAQCQSCHSATFHSLSDGHPEFAERDRAALHFDHVTHLNLHFSSFERTVPNGQARMQCRDCHSPDATGAMMRLESFDVMCASCHEPQIRDFDAEPHFSLHDLVFLDGNTDPSLRSPLMDLMLDETDDSADIQSLVRQLSIDGEETLRRRLHTLTDSSTDSSLIEACIAALKNAHFFDAVKRLNEEAVAETDAEPAEFDDGNDAAEVLNEETVAEPDAEAAEFDHGNWHMIPAKQHHQTEQHLKYGYRSNQHADDVLRTWIDLAAANANRYPEPPTEATNSLFDRILRDLAAPESTGRCLKCHTLEPAENGGLQVNWTTDHGQDSDRGFTWFSHKPHLTLLSSQQETEAIGADQRCESCHALDDESFGLVDPDFTLEDGMPRPAGVPCAAVGMTSTQRSTCVRCHTQDLAGDNCLQCHNYHIHP